MEKKKPQKGLEKLENTLGKIMFAHLTKASTNMSKPWDFC
jgi:hypothetical protein